MAQQDHASFADALRQALEKEDTSQVTLARAIRVDPSQVNRWVRGKALPHRDNVKAIETFLETDLSEAFTKWTPSYELFVSAPISGLADGDIPAHHDAVAQVVEAARQHVNGISWPGERISNAGDRRASAADLVTERNMRELVSCPAYLFLQFSEVIGPSSALVELGFALGRKTKVTIIYRKGLASLYMLRGFDGVAARLSFLPEARIYEVESVDHAVSLIGGNGRELLGLM
jgi:transcriptional regulator with XRE-family HTH domain